MADGRACDVLIVGAGPTGLLAASLLARCGASVRILDRSAGPAKESRAMAVQARTLELFGSIGLAGAFLDAGVLANAIDLVVGGKPAVAIAFDHVGQVDTPYPFPLMIPQSDTEAILSADLRRQGVDVEYGTTVTGFADLGDAVAVTAVQGDREAGGQARYLIGADGAHSIVRKTLGLSFDGASYPQNFMLADCTVDWRFGHDAISVFVHRDLFAAFFPMRGVARGRIMAIDKGDGTRDAPVDQQGANPATLAEVEVAVRAATQSAVTLSEPTWTARYRVHHRGVDRYRVGRVFVAGDAAHIHSPAGGQGMNTGLQDAANLAWKVAAVLKGEAPDALLDSYNDERWPVGRKVLERTDRMFATMTAENRVVTDLRDFALPWLAGPLMRSEATRARAFRFVSQLGIRYHGGPFVDEAGTPSAARAGAQPLTGGARAPDARIDRVATVFDRLGYHWSLLAFSWQTLDEAAVEAIDAQLAALPGRLAGTAMHATLIARSAIGRDPRLLRVEGGDVFATYGLDAAVPQKLVLVRPDGYVAFAADGFAFDALTAFLTRFTP